MGIVVTISVPISNWDEWASVNERALKASGGVTSTGAGTGFGCRDMDWWFEDREEKAATELKDALVKEFGDEYVSMDRFDEEEYEPIGKEEEEE